MRALSLNSCVGRLLQCSTPCGSPAIVSVAAGNGLQRLGVALGIQPVTAHRALADAQTTHPVFEKLIEPVGGWQICLADAMREQGGPMGLLPSEPKQSLLPLELEEGPGDAAPARDDGMPRRPAAWQHRVIRPIQLRRRNGEMILIAHCELRNGSADDSKLSGSCDCKRVENESKLDYLRRRHIVMLQFLSTLSWRFLLLKTHRFPESS